MFKAFFKKTDQDSARQSLTDPVCHMQATNGVTLEYGGQTYGFCSEHCKQEFGKNPEKYVKR